MKLPSLFAVLVFAHAAVAGGNPLPNPGFEDGDKGWALNDGMSHVVAEAAHEGGMGLRITDEDAAAGSAVLSSSLPVRAEQEITLGFWARTKTDFAAVYFFFSNAAGKVITNPAWKVTGGHASVPIKKADGNWNSYTLTAKAPPEAASVAVWIHSYSTSQGMVDLDDFTLGGIDAHAQPVKLARTVPPPAPPDLKNLPKREKPAVIIIKIDDMHEVSGKVHPLWLKVADFLTARKAKASIGVICETLSKETPDYTQWIKDRQASGRIEFWFHGFDHKSHEEGGKVYNEFTGRPFEEQKERFDRSQQLAMEKLGFPFRTFGPPGGTGVGSQDESTVRVMAGDPHMKIWLYPTPIDEAGRKLEGGGKITILDRVWDVNLERAVGVPDFNRFAAGYAKHPDREYFVLQGHPMQWGAPGKFEQFAKIIEFLVEQKAVFMTPSEYVAQREAAAKR